jgi:hypothetical protein
MSFANSVIKTSTTPINFFTGTDSSGQPAYWFVMCSKQKFMLLKARINTGPVDFADYGPIVASGFGTTPSAAILRYLKEEYNFDAEEQFSFAN